MCSVLCGAVFTPDSILLSIIRSIAADKVIDTSLPIAVFSPLPFSSRK